MPTAISFDKLFSILVMQLSCNVNHHPFDMQGVYWFSLWILSFPLFTFLWGHTHGWCCWGIPIYTSHRWCCWGIPIYTTHRWCCYFCQTWQTWQAGSPATLVFHWLEIYSATQAWNVKLKLLDTEEKCYSMNACSKTPILCQVPDVCVPSWPEILKSITANLQCSPFKHLISTGSTNPVHYLQPTLPFKHLCL